MARARMAPKRLKPGRRMLIAGLFVLALSLGGWVMNAWLTGDQGSPVIVSTVTGDDAELRRVFVAAVENMQRRDYQQALNLWHRALLLDSSLPEIKVNMGFTLFELGRYQTAREFFIDAMEQNAYQANAYYGLALVSEKMGDLQGAMGAMRSYIHLAGGAQDEEFVRRARAALWEWEAQLADPADAASKPQQ